MTPLLEPSMTVGGFIRILIIGFNDHELVDCIQSFATVRVTKIDRHVTLIHSFISQFKNNIEELFKIAKNESVIKGRTLFCNTRLFISQMHISRSKQIQSIQYSVFSDIKTDKFCLRSNSESIRSCSFFLGF